MMPAVFDRRFGATVPGTVGIEEELFVVSAGSLELAPVAVHLLDGARRKPELHRSLPALTCTPASSVADAVVEFAELRQGVLAELEPLGLALLASGTHPTAGLAAVDETSFVRLARTIDR